MKSHAVPQEIMSVEFKLFGNFLSLREFIYIAIGIAISYFIYFLMRRGVIPGILAWPAILAIGGGGTIISLVPFQGRSLETWITNYFTAIQKPTQRVWQKKGFDPLQTASGASIIRKDHVVSPPAKVSSQQNSPATTTKNTDVTKNNAPVEQAELKRLREISTTIQNVEQGNPSSATPAPQTPKAQPLAPITQPTPKAQPPTQQPAKPVQPSTPGPQTTSRTQPSTPGPQSAEPVQSPTPSPQPPQKKQRPSVTPATPVQPAKPAPVQPQSQPTTLTITDKNYNDFATEIPGVQPQKNTINLVVVDQASQFIPQVTCIVKDSEESPVRASISNQLGQIINNVPLKKGTYKIQLSKQGYIFPVITRIISGKIYPPLEIKSL